MDFKSLMLFLGRFTASSIRWHVRLKPTRVGSRLACTIDIVSSGWVVSRFSMVRVYSSCLPLFVWAALMMMSGVVPVTWRFTHSRGVMFVLLALHESVGEVGADRRGTTGDIDLRQI